MVKKGSSLRPENRSKRRERERDNNKDNLEQAEICSEEDKKWSKQESREKGVMKKKKIGEIMMRMKKKIGEIMMRMKKKKNCNLKSRVFDEEEEESVQEGRRNNGLDRLRDGD